MFKHALYIIFQLHRLITKEVFLVDARSASGSRGESQQVLLISEENSGLGSAWIIKGNDART